MIKNNARWKPSSWKCSPSSHISKHKYLTVFHESNISAKFQTFVIMFFSKCKLNIHHKIDLYNLQ